MAHTSVTHQFDASEVSAVQVAGFAAVHIGHLSLVPQQWPLESAHDSTIAGLRALAAAATRAADEFEARTAPIQSDAAPALNEDDGA